MLRHRRPVRSHRSQVIIGRNTMEEMK
jgi:hypothetical protein